MKIGTPAMTIAVSGLALLALPVLAASESDFNAAYSTAMKTEQQALAANAAWTTAESALADAKKAAEAKDYDKAVALAREAGLLAKASLDQARAEETSWRNAVPQ